jgi:hypothetical protein
MHDAEMRRAGCFRRARAPREDVIVALAQACRHGRDRRLVEVFDAARDDPESDRAHPVDDPGPAAQLGDDSLSVRLERIGEIDEAEAAVDAAKLRDARIHAFLPARA